MVDLLEATVLASEISMTNAGMTIYLLESKKFRELSEGEIIPFYYPLISNDSDGNPYLEQLEELK